MPDDLKAGLTFEKTITVTDALSAKHLAGQGIGVFSTPEMVRLCLLYTSDAADE